MLEMEGLGVGGVEFLGEVVEGEGAGRGCGTEGGGVVGGEVDIEYAEGNGIGAKNGAAVTCERDKLRGGSLKRGRGGFDNLIIITITITRTRSAILSTFLRRLAFAVGRSLNDLPIAIHIGFCITAVAAELRRGHNRA